ncbi:MAG: metallophosphoesterase [Hyphomicrobiaceae bacterium]
MLIELPQIALVLVHGAHRDAATAVARHLFDGSEILDMTAVERDQLLRLTADRSRHGWMTVIVEGGSPAGAHKLRVALASEARENYVRRFALILPDAYAGEPNIAARLRADGYREVMELASSDIDALRLERQRMPTDLRHESGPFDIIGDVHGCASELETLLARLGYSVAFKGKKPKRTVRVSCPPGRRIIFVGDLVDRGPRAADTLRIVLSMVEDGSALLVPGNHDVKFLRWLKGEKVAITHGLDVTVRDLKGESDQFLTSVREMLQRLWSHVWVDGGELAVAHAGLLQGMIGRATPRVRRFCLYGDTSGEKDEHGLPQRYHWALEYAGETAVIYGHTPVAQAQWVNNTLCVDTGCCFGGSLTALRWPEREIVAVAAERAYARSIRPFGHPPPRPIQVP